MMSENRDNIYFQNSSDYSAFPTSRGVSVNVLNHDSYQPSYDLPSINIPVTRRSSQGDYETLRARHRVRGGMFNSFRRSLQRTLWDEDSLRSNLAVTGTRYRQKLRTERIISQWRRQKRCGLALFVVNVILIGAIVAQATLNKIDENVLESVFCMKCKELEISFGNLTSIKEVGVGGPWAGKCCFDTVEQLLKLVGEAMQRDKTDNQKLRDNAIKEAFSKINKRLSQGSLSNPTGHVIGIPSRTSEHQEVGRGVMMWSSDSRGAFARNGVQLRYNNTSLVVPISGHYFIYSNVCFYVPIKTEIPCYIGHYIYANMSNGNNLVGAPSTTRQEDCEKRLNTSFTWNSFLVRLQRLYEGEAVRVEVSNIEYTEHFPGNNQFGMFLI